ncbi:MAG: hypothetical protein L0Y54_17885 [Sporichthyaceae bacterium]|nr:hypothetical protein [Sporichthyaceae bacterium]
MRTMRCFATVTALTALAAVGAVGFGPTAWAKGPTAATVDGPGLAKPVDIDLGMHGENDPQYVELMDASQVFYLGARTMCRLAEAPAGDLGPRYRLTWRGCPASAATTASTTAPCADRSGRTSTRMRRTVR